jgi:hypothetical protein
MTLSFVADIDSFPGDSRTQTRRGFGQCVEWNTPWDQLGKEGAMYISGGVLALIVIVVLLIWLL